MRDTTEIISIKKYVWCLSFDNIYSFSSQGKEKQMK